ncbi:hypothetical protein BD310DRAFT_937466 [Dichomitus squalens]|uniref:Uncharacterized protein n=1 Tax=Dichomitus squalens TaxID=114155 RepID=A0A4Q9PFH4_9APHY|nr:hypothetical protein BD310DRAFT_937466 [Dichomitus squalens]
MVHRRASLPNNTSLSLLCATRSHYQLVWSSAITGSVVCSPVRRSLGLSKDSTAAAVVCFRKSSQKEVPLTSRLQHT